VAKKKPETDDADDAPPPKSDAYVGLLGIALAATILGAVLMFLDGDELAKQQVPTPSITGSKDGLIYKTAAPAGNQN
jgi:hypothetical protein